jgi:hypothetical protein
MVITDVRLFMAASFKILCKEKIKLLKAGKMRLFFKDRVKKRLKTLREHPSRLFLFIFLAVIFVALFVIHRSPYTLFGGSDDSARYLLSALAQCQAAIIAIVVTLTLVAVQLASQTYSPRVMDLFLKSYSFWGLMLFYGLSIMYDFILLDMVTAENINYFAYWVNVGLVLMTGTFSALFLYMKKAVELLKPDAIIDRLGDDARKDLKSFVEAVYEKEAYGGSENNYPRVLTGKDDITLPLTAITKKSIRMDDPITARSGIVKLEEICLDVICSGSDILQNVDSSKDRKEKINAIIKHFTDHFIRILHVAFEHDDKDSVIEVTKTIGIIGEAVIRKEGMQATKNIAYVLNLIGMRAINQWPSAAQLVDNTFAKLYEKANALSDLSILNAYFVPFMNEYIFHDVNFGVEQTLKTLKDSFVKVIERDKALGEYSSLLAIIEDVVEYSYWIRDENVLSKRIQWRGKIIDYLIEIGIKAEKAEGKNAKQIREDMRRLISSLVVETMSTNATEKDWDAVISNLKNTSINICNGTYPNYTIHKRDDAFEWILTCMIDVVVEYMNKGPGSATKPVIAYFVAIKNECEEKEKEKWIENVFNKYKSKDNNGLVPFAKLKQLYGKAV